MFWNWHRHVLNVLDRVSDWAECERIELMRAAYIDTRTPLEQHSHISHNIRTTFAMKLFLHRREHRCVSKDIHPVKYIRLRPWPSQVDTCNLDKMLFWCQGIIAGDQIEVAAFSLASFTYLTRLVTAYNNAGSNSARARRLIQICLCFLPFGYIWSGAITASVIIGCDQHSQICKRFKRKSSYFNLVTFDNTLLIACEKLFFRKCWQIDE